VKCKEDRSRKTIPLWLEVEKTRAFVKKKSAKVAEITEKMNSKKECKECLSLSSGYFHSIFGPLPNLT